ncbi:hypothetical protein EX895_005863 [Sporisorium graminicola]|uniref:Uncharacterized protein n=1 Tax=Sporisorium graminicola TaxID=280036 RepID=A0A4U7KLF7_9BASI|nr:hypothetical protein EX895_005863 [Sporisorium graminicola]TKY84783.1 hypothetical protein EX895_005863 [Sporisorium graminicola]
MSSPSLLEPNHQRLVVALLNRASTTHRLTILDQLVSNDGDDDASSPFELVAERSLRLSLPDDDELLRSLLASEIQAHGEAETLVQWALKFTAATSFFLVLQRKASAGELSSKSIGELFLSDYAPALWEKYGHDEIYVSPNQATAEMQIELLFPDTVDKTSVDAVALPTEPAPATAEAPSMTLAASSSSEGVGAGSGFSQASVLSSTSTAATSTRPPSRASLVHPTPNPNPTFKARPIPSTVKSKPSIEPRLSKAAALRMGIKLPESPAAAAAARSRTSSSSSSSPSKDAATATAAAAVGSVGISGVAKRAVAPPVSLKAPSIAPRLNKAALARQGQGGSNPSEASASRRPASAAGAAGAAGAGHVFPSTAPAPAAAPGGGGVQPVPRKQVDYSNTPGHKRLSLAGGRSSIASIAPPAIAPRQNRASMSRIQHQPTGGAAASAAPPSAFKGATRGHTRAASVASSSVSTPVASKEEGSVERARRPVDFAHTPGHKRASLSLLSTIPSLAAPSLAPRQNRASLARARPMSSSTAPAPSAASTASTSTSNAAAATGPTDFTHTPGHKRLSLQFSLASLRAPSIQPRLNKAAGARIGAGAAGAGNVNTGMSTK